MKIIIDLDINQLHYIRAILRNKINSIDSKGKYSEYDEIYEEYRKSLNDILDQFR